MKQFRISVNGNAYDVQVEELGGAAAPAASAPAAPVSTPAAPAPVTPAASTVPAAASAAPVAGAETINAPMPGTVVNVQVKVGSAVTKGQVLLVLEAMKMENEIMSPRDGVVAGVHVNKGESVDSGKLLISLQ